MSNELMRILLCKVDTLCQIDKEFFSLFFLRKMCLKEKGERDFRHFEEKFSNSSSIYGKEDISKEMKELVVTVKEDTRV